MSKELDVSFASDTAQQPIKKGTLQFLQDMHKEDLNRLIVGLIGESVQNAPYVLFGCINSGSGLTYSINAGAVYYLGEVYEVPAASFTTSGGQVPIITLAITQYTTDADPVTFTDASSHDVHNIRKLVILAGTSGGGIADYSACIFNKFHIADLVAAEASRSQGAEAGLLALINEIKGVWTNANNASNINIGGGTGTAVTVGKIAYKIIGKTMHVNGILTATNSTAPTDATILLPAGVTANALAAGFSYNVSCEAFNGSTLAPASISAAITGAAPTLITMAFNSLTDGQATTVRYSATFEIA